MSRSTVRAALDVAIVEAFRRDGFVVVDGLLTTSSSTTIAGKGVLPQP